jgi:xanthine/CO dehydrogenase XdhC/CoxF family maturation factor
MVLMTHNYNYDLGILRRLLPLQLSYVASLGPKKRLQRMLDELQDEGMDLTNEQLKSIYGPAGIDIGSENSDEIALSIIAEIQAVLNKRIVSSLRDKTAVHNRHVKQLVQQNVDDELNLSNK